MSKSIANIRKEFEECPDVYLTDEELDELRFDGIVIPHEIAFDPHLNIIDKFIIMYVDMKGTIHSSDEELGEMFSTNYEIIAHCIERMLKLGYLVQLPSDKYDRVLKSGCSWQFVDDKDEDY